MDCKQYYLFRSSIMKKGTLFLVLAMAAMLAGCGPHNGDGMTIQQQQGEIDAMAQKTLQDLYQQKPDTRQEVQNASGVGVFSNASGMYIFVSAGGGYGVVVNNATGNKTYMKMATGGVGLGLGAKDYRQIMVFHNQNTLDKFITSGWDFGGQAGAAAKASESGGAVSGEGSFKDAVSVYTLTKTGLIAEAALTGTKYWVDDELNNISVTPR